MPLAREQHDEGEHDENDGNDGHAVVSHGHVNRVRFVTPLMRVSA
jgi:hypothetical protein